MTSSTRTGLAPPTLWFFTNSDATALCVQPTIPDAKYSVYWDAPETVEPQSCDTTR